MSSNLNHRVVHTSPVSSSAPVTAWFDNCCDVVCAAIRDADEVVACVAWLKCPRIIAALRTKPCTVLLTSDAVHRRNRGALRTLIPRTGTQAVRIVGQARGRFRALMHNKFLVVIQQGVPVSVLTGSFNYTAHSSRNLENVVRIDCPTIAAAYLKEAMHINEIARDI